jgi:hypothetical protein
MLQVAKGEEFKGIIKNIRNNNSGSAMKKIILQEVLLAIECLVRGIIELQTFGIFHEDLRVWNIMKMRRKGSKGPLVYQLIDFDWAFKVGR